MVLGLENAVQFWDLEGTLRRRYAGEQRQAGLGLFRCADGRVFLMAGGVAQTQFWYNTVKWLEDSGRVDVAPLKGPEWVDIAYLRTAEAKEAFRVVFEDFARPLTMATLYAQAQAYRVPLCPVNRPADLLKNRQLEHRGFFAHLPEAMPGRDLVLPGAPYRLMALEQQALVHLAAGRTDEAVALARQILAESGVTPGLQQRASELIVALGADPAAE